MAYNPYTAVNNIYNLKGQWEAGNNTGDNKKKNDAATAAQAYYQELRDNGYGDIADQLTAADYTQAKSINDKWAKTGKTSTRDYMYSLGKSYGMSSSDVDKLISWDNDTGQVSFGGKVIGTPDSVVDGVSYWGDTSTLDNAFNDYIKRSGTVRPNSTAINQENESLFAKYNQEYEDLKNTNPFTTEEAKAILAKYDLAGLQGRDNEAASGAGSNGGNIDSFAAANAMRQQSALINQGQMAVLEAHQKKLDHARNLLSDMGVNIDRVFNQEETAKNNKVSRDIAISETSGTNSGTVLYSSPYYSMFFNEDGTLKNEDIDYKEEIDKAVANGNTDLANVLRAARGTKIYGDWAKYGQYASDGDYSLPAATKTEDARRFDETNAYNYKVINAEQASNAANNATELQKANIDANAKITAAAITAAGKSSSGSNAPLSEKEVTEWVDYLNGEISKKYGTEFTALEASGKNEYKRGNVDADFIILQVLNSDDLTQEEKDFLLYDKFNITEDEVNTVLKDNHYR